MPEELPQSATPARQSTRFLLLYALAVAGGAVAYVPFLTILLPVRIEAMAGDESVRWLAYLAFAGAVAASVANIGFGWLSDKLRQRKALILAGLAISSALLLALSKAATFEMLIGLLIMWQLALNMMLSPLAAWAGDTVPDHQKGLLGGLLACAPATGALSGAIVTLPGWIDADMRMAVVAILVAMCVLPVMIWGRPAAFPELMRSDRDVAVGEAPDRPKPIVIRMWAARLLVQVAEAALFAYLYLWLRSINPDIADSDAAQVFFVVLVMTVPVSLLVGRWTDRNDRPILPLGIAASISAAALLAMAYAPSLVLALLGYAVFGLASHVFLSLHSAQTLRVLPRPETRGRDLGIFNLTNTLPSPIMSVLTIMLVPVFGFSGLFMLLAGLSGLAAVILLSARRIGHSSQIGA